MQCCRRTLPEPLIQGLHSTFRRICGHHGAWTRLQVTPRPDQAFARHAETDEEGEVLGFPTVHPEKQLRVIWLGDCALPADTAFLAISVQEIGPGGPIGLHHISGGCWHVRQRSPRHPDRSVNLPAYCGLIRRLLPQPINHRSEGVTAGEMPVGKVLTFVRNELSMQICEAKALRLQRSLLL